MSLSLAGPAVDLKQQGDRLSLGGSLNLAPFANALDADALLDTYGVQGTATTYASLFTFTRASIAYDFDSAGLLQPFAVNTIRLGYDPITLAQRGWRIEGPTTNGIRNPRAEGAGTNTLAAGVATPVPATNWTLPNRTAGLTLDRSPITVAGMTGVRLRYYGTSAASGLTETVEFEDRAAIVAAPAQAWTGSFYARLSAGALPGGMLTRVRVLSLNSGAVVDTQNITSTITSTLARHQTVLAATGAGVTHVVLGLHLQSIPASTACDFTIDLVGPQLEQKAYATSLMLPPAGTPAASTRAVDLLSIGGATFNSIFGAGATDGAVILDARLPAIATGANQSLIQLDTGANTDRIYAEAQSANGNLFGTQRVANVGSGTATAGATTADTDFRLGLRWASGVLTTSLNGAAPVSVTVPLPAGLTTLRVGHIVGGNFGMYGHVRRVVALDYAPADTVFQSLTAADVVSAEAAAVIAAMTAQPSATRANLIKAFVNAGLRDGWWSRVGALWMFAAHTQQAGLLNWKNPGVTPAVATGSPPFTTDRGYVGDGVGAYIETGIALNAIPGFAQDDAHLGAYGAITIATTFIISQAGTGSVTLSRSSGTLGTKLSSGTATNADTLSTAPNHLCSSRADSAGYARYINGTAGTAAVSTSTALNGSSITPLRQFSSYSPATVSVRALHAGASLSPAQVSSLAAAMLAYMTAIGANA